MAAIDLINLNLQNLAAKAYQDTLQLILQIDVFLPSPTPANLQAIANAVGTATDTNALVVKPTYSVDGESVNWSEYRQALIDSLPKLYQINLTLLGPAEVRSRAY